MNLNRLLSEIDVEATLDRLCGDADLLLEVLDLFLAEFTAEQQNLLKRTEEADFDWLAKKAHYFKGIAQNLGLIRFLPQTKRLEESAKLHDKAVCVQAVDSMIKITQHLQELRHNASQI